MCSQTQVLTSKFGQNYELIEFFGEQHFIPKIVVWRRDYKQMDKGVLLLPLRGTYFSPAFPSPFGSFHVCLSYACPMDVSSSFIQQH